MPQEEALLERYLSSQPGAEGARELARFLEELEVLEGPDSSF